MKEEIEYLGFEDVPRKVGRPKLATPEKKKKSLIFALLSFVLVIFIMIYGYYTLFGYKKLDLKGSAVQTTDTTGNILVSSITPIIKDITLQVGTARKVYLSVFPQGATNKNIAYESMNETVAFVDAEGKVSAYAAGKTKIVAKTMDGSNKTAEFNITVIKNSDGACSFDSLEKTYDGVNYDINCDNAKIKDIEYQIDNENYASINSSKKSGTVKFSEKQLKSSIKFKVIYYANSSSVESYTVKALPKNTTTTKKKEGLCNLTLVKVNTNSAKYDISCTNATVNKIAYKIGSGSYIGLSESNLADTVIFEESDVTRVIYFMVQYGIDGTDEVKTITQSSIIASAASK